MAKARLSPRSSFPLSIATALPFGHAVDRINWLITYAVPRPDSPRSGLGGSVEGDDVVLYPTSFGYRGRAWHVEFRGKLRPMAEGSELAGSFVVRDPGFPLAVLRMARIGALAFALVGTFSSMALHHDYRVLTFVGAFLVMLAIAIPFIGLTVLGEWFADHEATRSAETIERLLRDHLPPPLRP